MARDRTKLGDAEVQGWLKAHPGWALEGGMIRRTFAFGDFRAAMAFVNRVA
ncbi:MAG: 4a-hydroxytetrahydrobiopterin dehydratase, partial [Myxococcaceae bacterium]